MPTPIRFDQEAAAAVAGQLELAASSLTEATDIMQSRLPAGTDGWTGRFRSAFDGQCVSQLAGAGTLAQSFLAEAARVRALALEAQAANQAIAAANAKPTSPTPPGTTPTATTPTQP